MKAYLILNCDGRSDDGFVFCSGVKNTILDFERVRHHKDLITLIEYLDLNTKLFEGPCFEGNKIINAVYKLFELDFLTQKQYERIVSFYQWHKRCGMCLKIEPK